MIMSYLIKDNEVIAQTINRFKSGEEVRVAFFKSGDSLVNCQYARVSNAKKWGGEKSEYAPFASIHDESGLYKDFFAG